MIDSTGTGFPEFVPRCATFPPRHHHHPGLESTLDSRNPKVAGPLSSPSNLVDSRFDEVKPGEENVIALKQKKKCYKKKKKTRSTHRLLSGIGGTWWIFVIIVFFLLAWLAWLRSQNSPKANLFGVGPLIDPKSYLPPLTSLCPVWSFEQGYVAGKRLFLIKMKSSTRQK